MGSARQDGPLIGLGTLILLAQENGYVHQRSSEWIYRDLPQEVLDAVNAHATDLELVDGQYETLEDPTNERPLTARELMQGDHPRASFVWDKFISPGVP